VPGKRKIVDNERIKREVKMKPGAVEERVLKCLSENYGLSGTLKRLSGENLNYLLSLENGMRYVVKIVDDDMPPGVVEMEFEVLNYAVSSGFSLKLPRIIKNLFGNIETGIKIRINSENRLRVISFIDGVELETYPDISINMLKNVGETIAAFNLAMQGFNHPSAYRNHRWNLVGTGRHRDKIQLVEEPEKGALLEWGFDTWERVETTLESLPWQVIHGDLNRENILVEGDRLSGLVDFGDCCMNPTVCDLAISITYFMMEQENPMENARQVVAGYEKIHPLEEAERAVLLPLVCGRLAASIAISFSRRLIDPDNPNWFNNEDSAWRLLQQLRKLDRQNVSFQ
jgi:Ser/Thr protein kinase RdoA (MazF antagonist)